MKRLLGNTIISVAALCAVLVPRTGHAHFNLNQPVAADDATNGGKGAPPCGPTTASNVVTPVQGGQDLPIDLTETVLHPGHYRIALSVESRSELPPDPEVVAQNGQSVSATIQDPAQAPVLADGLFAHTSGATPIHFQGTVKLPNINCEKCTLQVIEFMAEHGPNPGGGFYYHHCADLAITADPNLPLDTDWPAGAESPDPTSMGGSGGAPAGSGGTAGGGGTLGGGTAGSSTAGAGGASAGRGGAPAGSGGTAMASGGAAAGRSGATAGSAATAAGASAEPAVSDAGDDDDDGGCALGLGGGAASAGGFGALVALALGLAARRRR